MLEDFLQVVSLIHHHLFLLLFLSMLYMFNFHVEFFFQQNLVSLLVNKKDFYLSHHVLAIQERSIIDDQILKIAIFTITDILIGLRI